MEHTPWTIAQHEKVEEAKLDGLLFTIRDSRNCYLASINKVDGLTYPDAGKIAKLIALVPELLDVCSRIAASVDGMDMPATLWEDLHSVIHKATN